MYCQILTDFSLFDSWLTAGGAGKWKPHKLVEVHVMKTLVLGRACLKMEDTDPISFQT